MVRGDESHLDEVLGEGTAVDDGVLGTAHLQGGGEGAISAGVGRSVGRGPGQGRGGDAQRVRASNDINSTHLGGGHELHGVSDLLGVPDGADAVGELLEGGSHHLRETSGEIAREKWHGWGGALAGISPALRAERQTPKLLSPSPSPSLPGRTGPRNAVLPEFSAKKTRKTATMLHGAIRLAENQLP